VSNLTIRISGYDLPGGRCAGLPGIAKPVYESVHVGVQYRREVVQLVSGDAAAACWDLDVDVVPGRDGAPDFRGPWVQGKPGDRFVYLSWGELAADDTFTSFRRAKLMLRAIDETLVHEAAATGTILEGRLPLTDAKGGPLCAAVRPPTITWSIVPAVVGAPT
jgi:hypothetical protein